MKRFLVGFLLAASIGSFVVPMLQAAEGETAPPTPARKKGPGLGDPGQLEKISVSVGRAANAFTLSGRDAQQQLVVTGYYATGQERDLSRTVTYQVEPVGIVQVDSTGLVTPVAEGEATITAEDANGQSASVAATVKNIVVEPTVNFPNQVVPVFTKLGCNSGGCHGKASGQNGFRLSLLGFEPEEDYEHLVKEGRGRRLFPASPDQSLLLQKAISTLPHGGGQRLEADSAHYKLLRRWIAQGLPYGKPDDATVSHIEMFPSERTLAQDGEQQLVCIAHYTDGSSEDVTAMAQFDPNDPEMGECSPSGLVKVNDLTGSVAIMARFQGHVAVFRATIPLGVKVENLPQPKNFIDELTAKQWQKLGMPPSAMCDDATFLRRASIDLAGRLPTVEEATAFAADTDPAKRDKWIDQLLASNEYADYFANKWSSVLRNKRRMENYARGTFLFHSWIRQSLHENKPYDQFVREIVAASGEIGENPPVVWYREVKESTQQLEDAAQLFLGLRIQCARCHHHPFEKWSQQDYYGFNAFFTRVGRKKGMQPNEERIYHQKGTATATNPKTKLNVKPTGLDGPPLDIPADEDPRLALADWMADPGNRFFAPALVNRYWKHLFGRGLVDPEDDMRVTNPASNPELLAALSKHFIDGGFDLKNLLRTICTSNTYQLSAEPNEWNATDKQNYSRYYPKRLNAEVLLDAIDQLCGTTTRFSPLPEGTRAISLPDTSFNSYFLTVFGRPEGASACECERTGEANLAQSLHLLNSQEVQGKLANGNGWAARLSNEKNQPHEQKITQLYRLAFARDPKPEELSVAVAHIQKSGNEKMAYEDLVWALINTKEFLFNH